MMRVHDKLLIRSFNDQGLIIKATQILVTQFLIYKAFYVKISNWPANNDLQNFHTIILQNEYSDRCFFSIMKEKKQHPQRSNITLTDDFNVIDTCHFVVIIGGRRSCRYKIGQWHIIVESLTGIKASQHLLPSSRAANYALVTLRRYNPYILEMGYYFQNLNEIELIIIQ